MLAARLRVGIFKHSWHGCGFAGQRLRRTHRAGQSWLARRCARILFCYWTWQDTLSQKLLDMAVKTWDGAQKDLEGAREDRDFARQRLRQAGDEKERKEAREELEKAKKEFEKAKEEAKRAESKVQTAKEEAEKANEKLEKAKSTAPLQAGDAFALLRVQFVQSTSFASWGHALLSARIPLFVKLFSLCWLAALRGVACFALALQVAVALF